MVRNGTTPRCMVTAVGRDKADPGRPRFFSALTVNYQERTYAAVARSPAAFSGARVGPSEKETLTCAPDRSSDPAAVSEGLPQLEVQIIATVDVRSSKDIDPDIRGLDRRLGIALAISGIPFAWADRCRPRRLP